MGHRTLLTVLVTSLLFVDAGPAAAQAETLEARLWVGSADEPVVRRGARVRIRYRTSEDAFVAVFRIDTDGVVRLLSPTDPRDDGFRHGGRDQALILARSPYWTVADDPGIGYMFLVASPVPFDFGAFGYHPDFGWDLSAVGTVVYDDPYLAMDDFIAAILPDWQRIPYALDFVTYHIDEPRSYPRFLCYDCHTYRSFAEWNPYASVCPSYRIVVYDDPYFYPAFRYAGTRVIYPRPLPDRPRYEVTRRRSGEAWAPIVRVRTAPPAQVTYKETPTRVGRTGVSARGNTSMPSTRPVRARPAPIAGSRAGPRAGAAPRPDTRPTERSTPSARPSGSPREEATATPSRRPARATPPSRRASPRASEPAATSRASGEEARPSAGAGRTAPDRAGAASRGATGRRPAAAPTRRPPPRPAARSSPPRARPAAGRGVRPSARPSSGSGAATRPPRPTGRPGTGGGSGGGG